MLERFRKIGLYLFLMLVVVLALLAYVGYHLASGGGAKPLALIFLVLLAFAFLRVLFRMRRKLQEGEGDE